MRWWLVAGGVLIWSASIGAARVAGTAVELTPPAGFIAAERFAGFQNDSSGASIMVTEIPGPFGEVTAGFSDPQRLQPRGMELIGSEPVEIDGQYAELFDIEQSAYGVRFSKWVLAVDRSEGTTLIVATYVKERKAEEREPLRTAILGSRFGAAADPLAALAFVVAPSEPFAIAKVIGQNMILTPGGRFPVVSEQDPILVVGRSVSAPAAADRKAFAEHRIRKTARVSDVMIERTSPVVIDGLSGFVTHATAVGQGAATPLTLYQVILFEPGGYYVVQGVSPAVTQAEHLPLFEAMATSLRRKGRDG